MINKAIFNKFTRFSGWCCANESIDFLGLKYNGPYVTIPSEKKDGFIETSYPEISEEYFEWTDILQSAIHANQTYLMFEIGAGYGRWGLRAWKAAKACGIKNPQVVCVEAEPQHAKWINLHFQNNHVPVENYKIIEAAISDEDGQADFFVQWPGWSREKSSKEWYGQALAKAPWDGAAIIPVKKMSVNKLLEPYKNQIIDLIDMDIQGEEQTIMPYLVPFLDNIKMIHIGTHGREIEENIKKTLAKENFWLDTDYACGKKYKISGLDVKFIDGIQTWKNKNYYKIQNA